MPVRGNDTRSNVTDLPVEVFIHFTEVHSLMSMSAYSGTLLVGAFPVVPSDLQVYPRRHQIITTVRSRALYSLSPL